MLGAGAGEVKAAWPSVAGTRTSDGQGRRAPAQGEVGALLCPHDRGAAAVPPRFCKWRGIQQVSARPEPEEHQELSITSVEMLEVGLGTVAAFPGVLPMGAKAAAYSLVRCSMTFWNYFYFL